MNLMANCTKSHIVTCEHSGRPLWLLYVFGNARIQLVEECGIANMELIWIDAYYIA